MAETEETIQDSNLFHSRKHLLAGMLLWKELHGRKMLNYRFERQRNLFGFIVDFYCYDLRLVILITRSNPDVPFVKEKKHLILEEKQMHVIHFSYNEIIDNMPDVLNAIQNWIQNSRKQKDNLFVA